MGVPSALSLATNVAWPGGGHGDHPMVLFPPATVPRGIAPSRCPAASLPPTLCTHSILSWGAEGWRGDSLHPYPLTRSLTTLAAFPTSALQGKGLSGQTSRFMSPSSQEPQLCALDRRGFSSISPGSPWPACSQGGRRERTRSLASQSTWQGQSLGGAVGEALM